ncbi:hypothetical protein DPMN_069679 [Dreissena polymorpha]|uniref:Uncharacterized protein n=1 Tax=Dreissena polymorpha TaxID=45954 RepID=A0A9D4BV47_DREPO|nr:hypothetical protein DPMN_069679 [Dreissena polymorpha]
MVQGIKEIAQHGNWTINVTFRVKMPWWPYIIGINFMPKFHNNQTINFGFMVKTIKHVPPPGSHVFQQTGTIFKLFHDKRKINVASRVKNAPPPGGQIFQPTDHIFKLLRDIIDTNLLT